MQVSPAALLQDKDQIQPEGRSQSEEHGSCFSQGLIVMKKYCDYNNCYKGKHLIRAHVQFQKFSHSHHGGECGVGTEVTDGCELSYRCWESHPVPQQERKGF